MKTYKALSIRQPWASLCIGYFPIIDRWLEPKYRKDVENRTWKYPPKYRGDLLIHASGTFDFSGVKPARNILRQMGSDFVLPEGKSNYRMGGIIGKVYMNDVVTSSQSPWFFGEYGFKFRMPEPIEFVRWKGNLGIFEVELPKKKVKYIEQ